MSMQTDTSSHGDGRASRCLASARGRMGVWASLLGACGVNEAILNDHHVAHGWWMSVWMCSKESLARLSHCMLD